MGIINLIKQAAKHMSPERIKGNPVIQAVIREAKRTKPDLIFFSYHFSHIGDYPSSGPIYGITIIYKLMGGYIKDYCLGKVANNEKNKIDYFFESSGYENLDHENADSLCEALLSELPEYEFKKYFGSSYYTSYTDGNYYYCFSDRIFYWDENDMKREALKKRPPLKKW